MSSVSTPLPGSIELVDTAATEELGARLAGSLEPGDLLLLEGPLGAGKTTLVRGLVRALGGDPAEVCSPTFILVETYDVASKRIRRVHHADLYRVRGRAGAPWDELGLDELLDDPQAVMAVEWPESWAWAGRPAGRIVRVRLAIADEARTAVVTVP
ncbi:MAG: tRNA (adenosine(37)-N6)-threonylcarbamoyltransferase complex ATPase subunit type 1 TsaE [Thermoanaerobaculaceae bacterium]|nr:tRNA (adenosine(37)-N6)-threonylcarbamoyltransferase complex ATPase subunit type 1 TsaE [Thermoanaerobaculaceae bacterium]MDI9621832.1 tRNA (adenosine(37)-N6)-threonylcarbamoyltransferase complex ATPase subunit type 1 TsaE [Acidobacteriota bacterium]HPW54453.1 tRNA (adenosine(37)-N6)-threonylcarbamoyltransferase complex ATPase subunit type 1 TsaE [Thermoanaerobaculaceae bacterium]